MNDKLIMKDGKPHKIAEVVMLPTDKASRDSYVQETGASHSCWTKNLGMKVSPDSTISIKPVQGEKTSWSREEVVALIQKLEKDGADYFGQAFLKQWIEENL